MIKLKDFNFVALDSYIVGVKKGSQLIEEFSSLNKTKMAEYQISIVTSVHVLNESEMVVNIEI